MGGGDGGSNRVEPASLKSLSTSVSMSSLTTSCPIEGSDSASCGSGRIGDDGGRGGGGRWGLLGITTIGYGGNSLVMMRWR